MAADGSFDQWQKDVFFTAAEEVQESADTYVGVYSLLIANSSTYLLIFLLFVNLCTFFQDGIIL